VSSSVHGRTPVVCGRVHRVWVESRDSPRRVGDRREAHARQAVPAVSIQAFSEAHPQSRGGRRRHAAPESGDRTLSSSTPTMGAKATRVKNEGAFPPAAARTDRPEEGSDDAR
jgi:hypothetical protein